jgi:hypothetical protein
MKKIFLAGALLGSIVIANADVMLDQVNQTSIMQNKVKELASPLTLNLQKNNSKEGTLNQLTINAMENAQSSAPSIAK